MEEENIDVVMYNVQYLCKYKNHELSSHLHNEEAILDATDELYRQDLLNIFMMNDDINETIITNTLSQIHGLLMKNDQGCPNVDRFIEYATRTAHDVMSTDSSVGLLILYSFHYLDKCHACVSHFLQYGKITDENMNHLLNYC